MSSFAAPRCQHVKVAGTQCGSPALRSKKFCYYHQQDRPMAVECYYDGGYATGEITLPFFEDAHSIQAVIRQVVQMVLQKRLERKTASLLRYRDCARIFSQRATIKSRSTSWRGQCLAGRRPSARHNPSLLSPRTTNPESPSPSSPAKEAICNLSGATGALARPRWETEKRGQTGDLWARGRHHVEVQRRLVFERRPKQTGGAPLSRLSRS